MSAVPAETPILREMDERTATTGSWSSGSPSRRRPPTTSPPTRSATSSSYTIGFDAYGHIFRVYRVFALPTQFFIAPDGRILEVGNGPLAQADATARVEAMLPEE